MLLGLSASFTVAASPSGRPMNPMIYRRAQEGLGDEPEDPWEVLPNGTEDHAAWEEKIRCPQAHVHVCVGAK